jgi:hypothetical protein
MKKNPNQELLVAGARDFLKASAAISKFGDEIYDTGLRVLKRRAGDLKDAVGIPLDPSKIKDYPKEGYIGSGYDGTAVSINVVLPLPNWNSFNLYVWWRTSDEQAGRELCSAVASVWCTKVSSAEALFEALRNRAKGAVNRDEDPHEVYIEKRLKPEDVVDLESHFEALVRQWVVYGKGIGGLKKHLKLRP